jgi:hypothetical protein
VVELDAGTDSSESPLPIGGPGELGWSIYGPERTQPVATGGESESREKGSSKPNCRNQRILVQADLRHVERAMGMELERLPQPITQFMSSPCT